PGKGAQNNSASDCRHRPGIVAVRPITEKTEPDDSQESSQHRPFPRNPALQHPADGGAHETHAEPDSEKRMTENPLAECQQQPLGRIVHRCVCGFLVDVKSFEMHPHRMSWIRQTSMGE